mgnify:CR=1 FL=1
MRSKFLSLQVSTDFPSNSNLLHLFASERRTTTDRTHRSHGLGEFLYFLKKKGCWNQHIFCLSGSECTILTSGRTYMCAQGGLGHPLHLTVLYFPAATDSSAVRQSCKIISLDLVVESASQPAQVHQHLPGQEQEGQHLEKESVLSVPVSKNNVGHHTVTQGHPDQYKAVGPQSTDPEHLRLWLLIFHPQTRRLKSEYER